MLGLIVFAFSRKSSLCNSSFIFCSRLALSSAPGQQEHQLSRGVSLVQAEWSGLTMGVSLTELGAFKHDDSYFRASCGGSLPYSFLSQTVEFRGTHRRSCQSWPIVVGRGDNKLWALTVGNDSTAGFTHLTHSLTRTHTNTHWFTRNFLAAVGGCSNFCNQSLSDDVYLALTWVHFGFNHFFWDILWSSQCGVVKGRGYSLQVMFLTFQRKLKLIVVM